MRNPMRTLYLRESCELCEMAEAMLTEAGLAFERRDIDSSPEMAARYGLRIPVVRGDDGRELDWPFAVADLLS
jgi:glutaredoxin